MLNMVCCCAEVYMKTVFLHHHNITETDLNLAKGIKC